jgi:hypothetical protein
VQSPRKRSVVVELQLPAMTSSVFQLLRRLQTPTVIQQAEMRLQLTASLNDDCMKAAQLQPWT